MMAAMAIILFPKLALGLSGFETGVAVMPLVRGDATDTEEQPAGRIRNTKKLLTTAALIMSVLLMASTTQAFAHARYDHSEPPAGAMMDGQSFVLKAYFSQELTSKSLPISSDSIWAKPPSPAQSRIRASS